MKIGRNSPCPCGSGKKYKHCCLAKAAAQAMPEELVWRRVRAELDGFPTRMLRFITEAYGSAALDEAWREFMLWPDDEPELDLDSPHTPVFMPWLFHVWKPDPYGDTSVEDAALHDVQPTRAYLDRKGRKLAPVLREYLQSCLEHPFSFYEIERCEPGRGVALRDVLTGNSHDVLERSASQTLDVGDLVYGQLAVAQGVTLLEACSAVVIPPIEKIGLVEFRKRMLAKHSSIDRDSLRDADMALRDCYLDIAQRVLSPFAPQMQTTDGEVLEFHKLIFEVESAQAAFDALAHLDFQATADELLEDARRNDDGSLAGVEIDWKKPGNRVHKQWENTVLGRVQIDGSRLTLETNSRERAEAFKGIVAERLGGRARLSLDEVRSVEEMMRQSEEADPAGEAIDSELQERPEVQALVRDFYERHYETWPDTPLPALHGRTPKEAVADTDGREQVEALVRQIERGGRDQHPPGYGDIISGLRRRLGLSGGG